MASKFGLFGIIYLCCLGTRKENYGRYPIFNFYTQVYFVCHLSLQSDTRKISFYHYETDQMPTETNGYVSI